MKRQLLTATCLCALVLALSSNVRAQNTSLEMGLRLADNFGVDATVPIGLAPRLHAAMYLERFGFGAYANWAFRLDGGPSNLRFFVGGGPEIFTEHQTDISVAADAGVEWVFDEFPITIGFDWRPAFFFTNGNDLYTGNWGFTARFRFGSGTFVKED